MSRIANNLKTAYYPTTYKNLVGGTEDYSNWLLMEVQVTIVCPNEEGGEAIARSWLEHQRNEKYFAVAILEGELESHKLALGWVGILQINSSTKAEILSQIKQLAKSCLPNGGLHLSAFHLAVNLTVENWEFQSQLMLQ